MPFKLPATVFALFLSFAPTALLAGGPKFIAGPTYFYPAVMGQPIHWPDGQVNYYVDQGPLSGSVSNQQAVAMVDAAAALWSAVPTAAVTLIDKGPLNEDVSASNIAVSSAGQITAPADVTLSAVNYPLAVLFDTDGSVINAIYGLTASQPGACQNNGVFVWIDNFSPDAAIAHGIILLNGLCATSPALLQMMSFQLERAFGRILGLDYSQVNPAALTGDQPNGTLGWPIMQPFSGVCGASGGACVPNPTTLRYDDIAALNRIYPITAANLAGFPGKQLTAANTISIQGTVSFSTGYPMQGVNVVVRPLDSGGNPLFQYTVTAITGDLFSGNHGNAVTGFTGADGNPLSMWGSADSALQGSFDASGIPLPPGVNSANYQVTFERINPLYILTDSVGPYAQGQVTPSGTLAPITLPNLSAGTTQTLTITAADSAIRAFNDAIGSESQPRPIPTVGQWTGRLSQVGQTDWFTLPVRGNRIFTIVTQAVDESGSPTNSKAMPSIGIWDAFDPIGDPPVGAVPGLNGNAPGETWLRVGTNGDDIVRFAIADLRGDGRPDYSYNGWLLYADSVSPARLAASGGPITIQGMGFRLSDTVLIGGRPAVVTSISPSQITAVAPPAASGVTGAVDVEVDDQPIFYAAAIIPSGISYDSGSGDALTLNTSPSNTVPIGVPLPFTVTALGSNLAPASGVTVMYTVTSGRASLDCGQPTCSVVTTGDGHATINVSASDNTWSIVTASLTNGSSLQAHFVGGTPPVLAALAPRLSIAAGATLTWTVQALVLSNGVPLGNQSVSWQAPAGGGISAQGSAAALSAESGVATKALTVGPLAEGQTATINACLNGTGQCVAFTAYGARPEFAFLQPISGVTQSLAATAAPAQIALRLLDMNGNPMAGGTVGLYQTLYAWSPPCAPHTVCTQGALLSTQVSMSTSAIDGSVTFTPASLSGVATQLLGLAVTGNSSSTLVSIAQHP